MIEHNFVYEYEDMAAALATTAERKLYLAVLLRALLDIMGNDKLHRRSAIAWLRGAPAGISFRQVCELFDFSQDRITKLEQYIEKENSIDLRFRIDPGKLPDTSI